MPTINNSINFEPSRDVKRGFLETRKHPKTDGGVERPGLIQTARFAADSAGACGVIAAEAIGLLALKEVGDINLGAALCLFVIDINAALMWHCGRSLHCEIQNRIVILDDSADQEAERLRSPWWHPGVRWLGALCLILLALGKFAAFYSYVGDETPRGYMVLVAASYFAALALHLSGATAYFFAEVRLIVRVALEQRRMLRSKKRSSSPFYIHGHRRHRFTTSCELVEHEVNRHRLQAVGSVPGGGFAYDLLFWGLPNDGDIEALIGAQHSGEQKAAVARAGVAAQVEILNSEPIGAACAAGRGGMAAAASPSPAPLAVVPDNASAAHVARAGIAALMIMCSLTGCLDKKNAGIDFPLTIVSSQLGGNAEAPLPVEIVSSASAPVTLAQDTAMPRPRLLRLDLDKPIERSLGSTEKTVAEKLVGGRRSVSKRLSTLRDALKAAKIGPDFAAPSRADRGTPAVEHCVTEASKAGGRIFAFDPTAPEKNAPPFSIAGIAAPRVRDDVSLIAAIADVQREKPGTPIIVLWKPAIAASQPPPGPPVEAPAKLRIGMANVGTKPMAELAAAFLGGSMHADSVTTSQREGDLKVQVHGERKNSATVADIELHELGEDDAVRGLLRGDLDTVLLTRQLHDDEVAAGASLGDLRDPGAQHVLGRDAVAVITALENPVEEITAETLRRILQGEIKSWDGLNSSPRLGGEIRVHISAELAAPRGFLSGRLMPSAQRLDPRVRVHSSGQAVAQAVARDAAAIGLVSHTQVGTAKILRLSAGEKLVGLLPTSPTIGRDLYALTRPLYLCSPVQPQSAESADVSRRALAARFVAFVESEAGQAILERAGIVIPRLRIVEALSPAESKGMDRDYLAITRQAEPVNVAFRFRTGENSPDETSLAGIDQLAALMRLPSQTDAELLLVGHADERGDQKLNDRLARERAQFIADLLLARHRIAARVVGLGTRMPVANNATEEGRARNRRVEPFIIRKLSGAALPLKPGNETYIAAAIAKAQREHVRVSSGLSAQECFSAMDLMEFRTQKAAQKIANALRNDPRFIEGVLALRGKPERDCAAAIRALRKPLRPRWAELGRISAEGQTDAGHAAELLIANAAADLVQELVKLPDETFRPISLKQ